MAVTLAAQISIIMRAGLVALALCAPAAAQVENLPAEVQIDLAVTALKKAIEAEDYKEVLARFDQLNELGTSVADSDLLYFEALAAKELGDLDRSEAAVTKLLVEIGAQSAFYEQALELTLEFPELRKARAEADRIAKQRQKEQQRIAEQRRKEQERTAREKRAADLKREREEAAVRAVERQKAGEAALKLSSADMRHILWTIHQHSGPTFGLPPDDTKTLSKDDRKVLGDYLRSVGIAFDYYLNERIARHFKAKRFVPHSLLNVHGNTRNYKKSGDWLSYIITENGRCEIRTGGISASPGSVFAMPNMRAGLAPSTDSPLGILLANPNPFRTDRPVQAVVDGTVFPTLNHPDYVGVADNKMARALRAGETVEVRGIGRYTNDSASVRFSLTGFTAAYLHMVENCNRPDIVEWLR